MSGPVIYVTGVAGSGKSTVGRALADRLGLRFIEGDDYHPAANIAQMAAGRPLTDEMRWPWLRAVAEAARAAPGGAVVSCSALRRAYRDFLRGQGASALVMLDVPQAMVAARLAGRRGHFLPVTLIDSQFATLEFPEADEPGIRVLDGTAPVVDIVAAVLRALPASGAGLR